MTKKAHIGVDLHTNNFTACFIRKGEEEVFDLYELTNAGFSKFLSHIRKNDEIAVEAVSNVAYFCERIKSKTQNITLVAPGKFSIIGKSAQKSDLHDAHKLALFLSKGFLPKARLKKPILFQLSSLIDTRMLFVRARVAIVNKMHAILVRHGVKATKKSLLTQKGYSKYVLSEQWDDITMAEFTILHQHRTLLDTSIKKLDKEIEDIAKHLYGYENLLSISGIGPLSAAILISVIGDINDFDSSSKFCSYFGLVPRMRQSNDSIQMGRITKTGSKIGRSTIVQATWIAIRYSDYLKAFFEKIKAKGNSKKAIVACSRKLLVIVYHTLKNDWVFDDFPNYKYHIRKSKTKSNI